MDVMRSRDDQYKHFNKLKNNVKAYKLLLQGMSLVEIAITLNLSYIEIRKYLLEYLQLKKMHKLYKLYVKHNGKIGNILYIADFIFRNKIDKKNISYVLKIADNVTTLEQIYSYLVESVTRETKVNNYYGNIENQSLLEKFQNRTIDQMDIHY